MTPELAKKDKTKTAIIAPADAIETKPKESFSEDLLFFFNLEIPTDKDSKNGTAKTPVVAPDASNANAINSF